MAWSNIPKTCYRPNKFKLSPCYGCEDRTIGCHETCDKYKDFHNEALKDFRKRKDTYTAEVAAETFSVEQKLKVIRKRRKR